MKRKHNLTIKQRILRNVKIHPKTGCWEWQLKTKPTSYGVLKVKAKQIFAHRLAYQEFVGPIPKHLFVCHSCDNRVCCNPTHLWLGTIQDNVDDMIAKGRQKLCKREPKLKREEIEKVLQASDLTQKELAAKYKVSQSLISRVLRAHGVSRGKGGGVRVPPVGTNHPRAKFSEEQIRSIRRSSLSRNTLAATFDCSPSTIEAIQSRRNWKHVK